jgi:demethylmenaquinone methyltransferase/2-methoxy-6-polyprenyl-1,4-benzoquinol methylase
MALCSRCGLCVGAVAVIPLAAIIAALLEKPTRSRFAWDAVPEKAVHEFGKLKQIKEAVAHADTDSVSFGSGKMFDKIAFAYDIGNRWMSLGLDQFWRKTLLDDCMQLRPGDRILDLATGTADVAMLVGSRLKELASVNPATDAAVVGVDPSREMLRKGVEKIRGSGLADFVHLHQGDAQNLTTVESVMGEPLTPGALPGLTASSLDKISMAFGIRNVPDRGLALREMARVLRKNSDSRVCILEFSLPDGSSSLSKIAQVFIQQVIPLIGKIATLGRGGAEYEYLERSIVEFPGPKEFASQMTQNGLPVENITSFAFGSVQLYSAFVRA